MAVRVDASGDSLSRTTNLPTITGFTIMGWFYLVSDRGTAVYQAAFALGDSTGSEYYVLYWEGGTNGRWGIWNGNTETAHGSLGPSTGTWYFLAMSVEGTGAGQHKVYIYNTSGSQVATLSGFGYSGVSAGKLWIANDNDSEWSNTRAAAIKIYDAVLTQAEIEQEIFTIVPKRLTNLNGRYPGFPGSGERARDYSGNGYNFTENGTLTDEDPPPISWGAPIQFMPVVAAGTTYNVTATLAGTSSAVTVGKNTIPFTSTLAGTSSVVTVGKKTNPFTSTLAGTSSAVTVGKNTIPYTATLAGTSSAITVGKNTIPYTSTLAGTSSVVTVGKNTIPYTATLAGTSSAITVGKNTIPYTSTLAGTSSLISVGNNINRFTTTLAATSSLLGVATNTIPVTSTLAATSSAVTVGKNTIPYTATLAGTSSLIGIGKNALPFTATLAGTSILGVVGTINGLVEFIATLAGASSLVSVGKNTLPITSTLAGTSTLTALGLRVLYLAITLTATSSLESVGKNTIPYTITLAGTSSLTVIAGEEAQVRKTRFFRRYVQVYGRGDKQRG